jgi:hypothetical protein
VAERRDAAGQGIEEYIVYTVYVYICTVQYPPYTRREDTNWTSSLPAFTFYV